MGTTEAILINLVMVVLFSVIIIIREWISARLQKAIQRENDAKMESLKADFQRQAEEHKTQFNYWHAEKAAAIKDVFGSICELYSFLKYLEAVDNASTWKANETREDTRVFLKDKILETADETARKWMKLRLFLDDKDDIKLGEFQYKAIYLLLFLFTSENEQKTDFVGVEKHRGEVLVNLERIIETLRKSFQDTLRCYSANGTQISCSQEPLIKETSTSTQ